MSLLLALLAVRAIGPDDSSAGPTRARRRPVDEGGLGALVLSAIGPEDARPNRRPLRAPDDSWSPKPLAPGLFEFTGGEDSWRPSVRGRYVDEGGIGSTARSAIGPDDAASARRAPRPNDEQVVIHPTYLPIAKVAWEDASRPSPARRQAHDEGGLESSPRSSIGPDESGTPRRISRPNDEQIAVHPTYLPLAKVSWNDETARPGTARRSAVEDQWSPASPRPSIGPDDARRSRSNARPRDDEWAQKPLVVTALLGFRGDDDARPPIARRQRPDESWSLKPLVATALLEFVGSEDARSPSRPKRSRDDEWSEQTARPFLFADDARSRRQASRPIGDPWSPRSPSTFVAEPDTFRPRAFRRFVEDTWSERATVPSLGVFVGAEDVRPPHRLSYRFDDGSVGRSIRVTFTGIPLPPSTRLMPSLPPQSPLYVQLPPVTALSSPSPHTLSRFRFPDDALSPPRPRRPRLTYVGEESSIYP